VPFWGASRPGHRLRFLSGLKTALQTLLPVLFSSCGERIYEYEENFGRG
jgi:hypothetical protein